MPGSVFQRGDGLWVAQISVGPRTARRTVRRYGLTREAAEAKLPQILAETGREPGYRFWPKVDRSGGPGACWPWLGKRIRQYGYFNHRRAHRVAWELTNGPVPDGLYILHSCDNPPCCNPAHLRPGDQFANMADMHSRGRSAKR